MHVKFPPHVTHTFTAWCFRHRSYLLYISLWYVADNGVLVMLWATTYILTHYWTLNSPSLSHCCSGCHNVINLLLFVMCHGSTASFSTSSCFTVTLFWGKKATKIIRLLSTFHTNYFAQCLLHSDWCIIFASLWMWLACCCFIHPENDKYSVCYNGGTTSTHHAAKVWKPKLYIIQTISYSSWRFFCRTFSKQKASSHKLNT